MKRTIPIIILTAIYLIIPQICLGFSDSLSIKIANGDWPPYFSEKLRHNRVVSRIVKDAFEIEGIGVEYVFLPWKRGLVEAKAGKWTGAIGWLKTEDREKQFYFSKPIMDLIPVFFQRKDYRINWNSMAELKGKRIGATYGFFYGSDFAEAEKNKIITVDRTTDSYHNLKKLIYKRVDLAAVEREVGLYLLMTKFSSDESVLVEPQLKSLHSEPAYLLISKKVENSKDIIRSFNRGFETLMNDGRIGKYWIEFEQGYF